MRLPVYSVSQDACDVDDGARRGAGLSFDSSGDRVVAWAGDEEEGGEFFFLLDDFAATLVIFSVNRSEDGEV